MKFGSGDNEKCSVDGQPLIVELYSLGMTFPQNVAVDICFSVGWFVVFCVELDYDDVTNTGDCPTTGLICRAIDTLGSVYTTALFFQAILNIFSGSCFGSEF